MLRRSFVLGLALSAMAFGVPANAQEVPAPVLVTGPGSLFTGYTMRVFATTPEVGLTFLNLDIAEHDVDSVAGLNASGTPCSTTRAQLLPSPESDGACVPVFESDLVLLGKSAPVRFNPEIVPGAYEFYCSIHTNMRGVLVVG